MLARTKGRRNGALPSTADPRRIARRAERKAFRNTLSRSRRRSGVLGHFREIDAASPKANALLQPADLHGEDHRLDRSYYLTAKGRPTIKQASVRVPGILR